jgi:lipoprotein-releasing system permease protein
MSFVPIGWHWDVVVGLNMVTLLIITIVLFIPTALIPKIQPIKAIRFD